MALRAAVAELAEVRTDPVTVDRLTRLLADHATLDQGLTLRRLADLAGRLGAAGPAGTTSETIPVAVDTIDEQTVLVLASGADEVLRGYGATALANPPADRPVPYPTVMPIHPC